MNNLIPELIERSKWLRKEIFEMVIKPNQGHIASALSQTEILISIYYGKIANIIKKNNSKYSERDRIIVSKGHSAMGVYPILADLGFFSKKELSKYGTKNGILRIYGDKSIPGIETTSGSLAQAPGVAAGFAYCAKREKNFFYSYVVLSDGEHYEGQLWETAMFASHYKLDNLVFIVDRNKQIILGKSEDLLKLEPLGEKWKSFGWNVFDVNGHKYSEILPALIKTRELKNGKPSIIIANTIKGKGISYMEDVTRWHNTMPNKEQIKIARNDLENNCIYE
jgi:transketolase